MLNAIRHNSTIAKVMTSLRSGMFAISDQALFAGTSLIVNILLARWLLPADYGAFATAYSLYILLIAFHNAFLVEPMLVYGSGEFRDRFPRYLAFILYGHLISTIVVSITLVVAVGVVWLFTTSVLLDAVLGMVLVSPLSLALWIFRRASFIVARPEWATAGGFLSLTFSLVGMFAMRQAGVLSPFWAFVILAASNVAASGVLIWLLRPAWRGTEYDITTRSIVANHWAYGKWAAPTLILVWIPANCYFLLLPLWHDLESSAMLKVIMILLNPMLQTITALTILLIPTFVKRFESSGTAALDHLVQVMFKVFLAGGVGYWLALSLARSPLIDLLYGADYAQAADLLVIAGFLPVTTAVIAVFGGALRAARRPDQVFRGYIASTLFTLTAGFAFVYAYGVDGAVLGIIGASAVTAFSIYRLYKRVLFTAMERDVQ